MTRIIAVITAICAVMGVAYAVDPDEQLSDPIMEERAREIGRELRCVTCQSQSIEDSNAPLAKDLRLLVRERLEAGDSDDEIVAYVTDRYGDYVRLRPRLSVGTAFLWATPLLALGVGGALFFFYFRNAPDDDDDADETPSGDQ